MMRCIEKGDADSILSWHPDRLARNSIDGGKIIYLLDTGKLASLKFPTFWCDSTSQGKFMLNMAFGQSKNIDKIASDSDLFAKKVCAKEIFGSNLLLGEKSVRASAPKILNSFGKMGGNQWDARSASHLLALKKPLSSVLVSLLYQVRTYFQNK